MMGFLEFLRFCRWLDVCKEIIRWFGNSCLLEHILAVWMRVELMPSNLDVQPVCYLDPILDSGHVFTGVQENFLRIG